MLFDKNPEEIIPSKLSSFTSVKLEEDKNKALKLLDFYKNSLQQQQQQQEYGKSESKNSKQNESTNKLKISSAEIYLTKNILIDDQDHQLKHASYSDSDYYEISKKTNENETVNSTKNEDQISAGSRTSTAAALATATITSLTTSSAASSSKKSKDISSEEEILCDLEVASYFDDRKFKISADDDSIYYYEKENKQYETNSDYKSKSSSHNGDCYPDECYPIDVAAEEEDDELLDDDDQMNDVLDDVIDDELDELRDDDDDEEDDDDDDEANLDDEIEDEDSNNLEYLVRQLAAEATLSLGGKKILNNYKKSNYDNSINKKLEKDYPNACVLKNKIFSCSSNENHQKFINTTVSDEEEEQLVYDLESNFGLNDFINDCHDEKQFFKKDLSSKSELEDYNENRFNDEDYDYNGSYSKSDTSESLNGLKMSTLNFSVMNGETNLNVFNSNNNNSNSKYINGNGFSSLRNNNSTNSSSSKPKPNVFTLSHRLNNQQLKSNLNYEQKQLEKELFGDNRQKRSSSTSSTGQQSHVVKLISNKNGQSVQHYQQSQQLPQHNYQQQPQQQQKQAKQHATQLSRKENEFNNIKIEKKIRLNYNRPQNFNSILNFGTLC